MTSCLISCLSCKRKKSCSYTRLVFGNDILHRKAPEYSLTCYFLVITTPQKLLSSSFLSNISHMPIHCSLPKNQVDILELTKQGTQLQSGHVSFICPDALLWRKACVKKGPQKSRYVEERSLRMKPQTGKSTATSAFQIMDSRDLNYSENVLSPLSPRLYSKAEKPHRSPHLNECSTQSIAARG